MTPGKPALCEGTVFHRRMAPKSHEFTYPVSQVWIDPDRPDDLCDLHPAWSHSRMAPARFRRSDYGLEPVGLLADAARQDVARVLGRTPHGPVRMLSQIRRWGWLFNPITVFFVWDDVSQDHPIGAVLEVTNTPWKERVRYPLALEVAQGKLSASFDKAMHVSPFLGMDYRYLLSIENRDDAVRLSLDVADFDGEIIVHTALHLDRQPASTRLLTRSLLTRPLPTHRVSGGIHSQAARLLSKRVHFVPHPSKSTIPVQDRHKIEESI